MAAFLTKLQKSELPRKEAGYGYQTGMLLLLNSIEFFGKLC